MKSNLKGFKAPGLMLSALCAVATVVLIGLIAQSSTLSDKFAVDVKEKSSILLNNTAVDVTVQTGKISGNLSAVDPAHVAWAHTQDGRGPCSSIGPLSSLVGLAPSVVWSVLAPQILNASYFPEREASSETFRRWVDAIFAFHTAGRLRRSMAHPPSTNQAVRKLLQLAEEYLSGREESIDPSSAPPPPIRILALGGSVTQGIECSRNSAGLPEGYWHPNERCAWPWRLEHMLNRVLFGGRRVVEMINFGMGGTNSEIGSLVLEYQLLPPDLQQRPPHVILSSYSANDARDPDLQVTYRQHLQNLVRAAHRLRPCDEHLPLVVLVDDLYGGGLQELALEQTGHLYKIASWYNVMAVVYSNVARHQVTMFHVNDTYHPKNPLLGSTFDNGVHLGTGFHIGLAWTILFNFLAAIQDACSDSDPPEEKGSPEWMLEDPPTKYRGRIGRTTNVKHEWVAAIQLAQEQCSQNASLSRTTNSSSPRLPYSTNVCEYAWMVNRQTSSVKHELSISEPKHVTAALEHVLTSSRGWQATGYPIRQPRTGYYALEANATFTLELDRVRTNTNFVTILSMKSYGPLFVGSQLKLSVVVRHRSGNATLDGAAAAESSSSSASFLVDGYHEIQTSVHFPHKFPLPGGGAKPGDSIRVDAQLVGGHYFKIAGIALCRQ